MSRSNYNKPFYVDVGTSIVAIRCASNHDVIFRSDYSKCLPIIKMTEDVCDRMNREVEISRPLRNCDVGTGSEQWERYLKYCNLFPDDCDGCPCKYDGTISSCRKVWELMPYEKEETK